MAAMNNLVISVLARAGHTGNAARCELGCGQTGGLGALALLGLQGLVKVGVT